MTHKEYLEKRNELMNQAKTLIDAGKIEESNAVMEKVKALDGKHEEEAKARANLDALNDSVTVTPIENLGVTVIGGVPAETTDASGENPEAIYEHAFYNAMMGNPLSAEEMHAMDEQTRLMNATVTLSEHQMVVPKTVAANIWMEMENAHPIITDTPRTTVPGDYTIIIDADTGSDGEWLDESTESTDDSVTTAEVNLVGHELAKSITVSWKLKKMAMADFLLYIARMIGRKMGNALAAAYISGKGAPGTSDNWKGQPRGVITALTAVGPAQIKTYKTANGVTYDDMVGLMSLIKSGYMSGSSIYANNATIWNVLAKIVDGNKKPYFIPDPTSGGIGRLFGVTVKEEAAIPDGGALLANMRDGYVCNVQENVTIYTDDKVKARTTTYMAYCLIDGNIKTKNAFAYLKAVTA